MADGVIKYLALSILLMCCDCSSIKRSTNQQDTDFKHTEVVLPKNLKTDDYFRYDVAPGNLPSISDNLAEIVNMLNNQVATQEKILILLTIQAASLNTRIENQNQIASLLLNITRTLNAMTAKHDHMETLLSDMMVTTMTDDRIEEESTAIVTTHAPNEETTLSWEEMTQTIDHQQESTTIASADTGFRDCTDIASYNNQSGPYTITPNGASESYTVRCDLERNGGGWTVIQRRFNGSVDFYRDWQDYVDGFGDPDGELWAGLELIHLLTKTGTWELRIDLEDFDGNTAYDHYASFRVGDAESNYRLSLGIWHGTAGNGLACDDNVSFSTRDNDNDRSKRPEIHCAELMKGAWWYSDCSFANPNGKYLGPDQVNKEGLAWPIWKLKSRGFKGSYEVLKKSEMKIRRRI